MSHTPEYHIWQAMKQRCHNPRCEDYHNYGGRGIVVCEAWRNDFMAFRRYMGQRTNSDYTIDRKDPNGNYEPGNVRWATRAEQNRNKRGYFGGRLPTDTLVLNALCDWEFRFQLAKTRRDLKTRIRCYGINPRRSPEAVDASVDKLKKEGKIVVVGLTRKQTELLCKAIANEPINAPF